MLARMSFILMAAINVHVTGLWEWMGYRIEACAPKWPVMRINKQDKENIILLHNIEIQQSFPL